MCGIAGVLAPGGDPDVRGLEVMSMSLAHRGPDDVGTWVSGPIALAHRRLAIRDLSPAGHEPMTDSTGAVAIAFNGELYNDGQLRRALERDHGVRFRGRCDAEILPAGWVAWGPSLFERLRGIFAVAIWDGRTGELVLARDHVGTKPLFYAWHAGELWFASELKALVDAGVAGEVLDPYRVRQLLTLGYTDPDATLLPSVQQVPPGSYVVASRAELRVVTYWRPRRLDELRTLDDAVAAFSDVWADVVEDQLVSDVAVGVLQSGGIDSSSVLAALPENADARAFTARFADPSHDESERASDLAAVLGRPITVVDVPIDDGRAIEVFTAVVRAVDGQLADSSTYVEHLLCEAVAQHVRVVLSGDGADELFGGYPTYRATLLATPLGGRVPLAAAIAGALARVGGGSERRLPPADMLARLFGGLAAPVPHLEWRRLLSRRTEQTLFAPSLLDATSGRDGTAGYADAYAAVEGGTLTRALDADLVHYLPADMLRKVDAASMAHSLEVRVPFLDQRIVDVAHRISTRALVPLLGPTKPVLRAALRGRCVPDDVVRGSKRGFQVPIARLLRTGLAPLAAEVLDRDVDRLSLWVRPEVVRRLWTEHRGRERNHAYALWALLTLGVWLRDR